MATTKRMNSSALQKQIKNKVNKIDAVWFEDHDQISSDWDSYESDNSDYISQIIMDKIHDTLNLVHKRSYVHEILFTPKKRIFINRYSHLARRSILMKVYNDRSNIKVLITLIKYYNKHGYLNSSGSYKFIEMFAKRHMSLIVKKLSLGDVNNIRADRYGLHPCLLKIAMRVRNRFTRRNLRFRSYLAECKQLVNKLDLSYVNPFAILNVEDGMLDDASDCEEALDLEPSTSRAAKQRNTSRYFENEEVLRNAKPYKPTVIPVRDYNLLIRLRQIIKQLVNNRKKKIYQEDIEMETLEHGSFASEWKNVDLGVQPEMMDPESVAQQQSSGPVVLNAIEESVVTATTEFADNSFWVTNSTGDAIVNQEHASSMEILVKMFEWRSDSISNFKIFDIELPVSAISENPQHPAAMLFNQYAYWNGDIRVRIHINTTPFHVGKLIFSWYYAAAFDANVDHRDNIASSLLLPHVCFNAADGNDVVLEIPFRNYRSMLCTRKTAATDSKPLYLGNLRCHVFNALQLIGPTIVDGYVHVSFVNNQFTGISPRIAVQAEMLPTRSMIKVVEGALTTIDKIANMDKPSNPVVPTMFMPQLTDSFASGTNDVNNVHMLRLNPLGQTPHPIGSSTSVQETLINNIIHIPGLLRLLKWDTSSARGFNIMRLDVSPELTFTDYYSVTLNSGNQSYAAVILPPVSAISCINAYNRGSIKYTIEIICSRYHTGALLVSFTPRASNVSLSTAIQSYNATLDIGNVKSYDFIVPYINERPYNPRFNRESSDVVLPKLAPIGEFNIFVLNELRSVTGTSNSVYINVYMSAGNDFEVAVPVPPLYSVNYDYAKPAISPALYLNNLSATTGLDTWRYFYPDDKLVIFKLGTGADDIAQLDGAEPFVVYEVKPLGQARLQQSPYIVSSYTRNAGKVVRSADISFNAKYFAVIIVHGDKNKYRYIAPFYDLSTANSYVVTHKSLVTTSNQYPDSPSLSYWAQTDPNNAVFYLAISNTNVGSYRSVTSGNATTFPFVRTNSVEAQMDNIVVDPTISNLPSAMNGLRLFGEKFTDLKDYGRRYQLYGSAYVKNNSTVTGFRIRVPITPIGLASGSVDNGLVQSVTREGMIGYIASAFRFYRGSLRFKLIVTTHREMNSTRNSYDTWYIQHKPDVLLNSRDINVKLLGNTGLLPSDILQSGYAYTAFSPHVNNSITFEIPCYIPTNLLMLQKPNFDALAETLHYTLGCFDVYGYTNRDSSEYSFVLHYALGDDLDMSCFVGFPPMIPLYSLPTKSYDKDFELVQPEMDEQPLVKIDDEVASTSKAAAERLAKFVDDQKPDQKFSLTLSITTSDIKSMFSDELSNTPKYVELPSSDSEEDGSEELSKKKIEVQDEGIVKRIKSKISNALFKSTLQDVRTHFDLEQVDDGDTVFGLVADLSKKIGKEYKDLIISIVSQILHCMISPEIGTFVTALVTVLAHLGIRSYNYISKFTKMFTKYFTKAECEMDDNKTEISSKDAIEQSFTMAIVSMGVSLFKKPMSWLNNFKMPCFSKGLFNEVRCGALTVTSCITMFRNLAEVVPSIISWIARNLNPIAWYRWMFSDKKDFIRKWVSDVEWFTDPHNAETVKSNMKYAYHGELLVIVGRDICLKLNKLDKKEYDGRYINGLMMKLQQTYQSVVSNFKSISGVGVEPYAFRIIGDSQVGKSYIAKELTYHALSSIGYKSFGNLIYTRPKTRHFDGLTGIEAAIYYDDFLHIKTDESASEQIAEILTLKSKCVFVPPRAELTDKGKPFNPTILAATMNEPYPDFSNICGNQYAWQNRFDDMIRAEFCAPPEFPHALNCNDLPYETLIKYDHCKFKIYKYRNNDESHPNAVNEFVAVEVPDVANGATSSQIEVAPMKTIHTLNFTQLKWYIAKQFGKQMEIITRECMKDLDMIKNFRPDIDQEFSINIDKYLEFIRERSRVVNVQEAKTIDLVKKLTKNISCDNCKSSILSCPCSILNPSAIGKLNIQAEIGEEKTILINSVVNFEDIYEKFSVQTKEYASFGILRDLVLCSRNNPTIKKQLLEFCKKPCIHKYVNLTKSSDVVNIDYFNTKLCFITPSYVAYEIDDDECCKLLATDIVYKKYILSMYEYQHNTPAPEFLQIKTVLPAFQKTLYYEKLQMEKEKFAKFVEKNVSMDTWMTKHGSTIWSVCKTLGKVLITVGAIYALVNYKALYNKMVGPYTNLKQANQNYAKVLEDHTITEECLKGECAICIGPQMAYDEKKMLRRPRRVINAKIVEAKSEPQMATDLFNSLNTQLKRNYFYIVAENGIEQSVARCLGIRGKWFIAVDHYFHKFVTLGENTTFYYCDQQQNKRINFRDIKITKIRNSAIVLCLLPREFPSFKDIVKRFVGQDYMANISPSAMLYEPQVPDTEKLIGSYDIVLHRNNIKLVDDTLYIPDINGKDTSTTCDWYWEYTTSGKGLCGSIIITDMNITAPIAGMHVAGRPGGGCGFAEVICRETLENALEVLEPTVKINDIEIEGQMFKGECIRLNDDPKFVKSALDGDFIFTGVVPSKFAYRPPTKSKLLHTLCYNKITKSTYDYPHLSHKDPRFEGSPMVNGCLHHTDPPLTFPSDVLDIVHDDIKQRILAKVRPVRVNIGVLSIVDSICGLPMIPQYGAMEMDTSEGFPFSSIRPKGAKDKRWLFELEETADGYNLLGVDQCLLDVMATKQQQRELGIVPLTVFIDCLKDAKLPKEKCNKTRIFSISPVDFTIQFRQYFYDFTIAFQESRFDIESAVGINVDSYEWHNMVTLLLSNSQKFVCGDYSKFGPRLMSDVVIRFFEIICDWYEQYGDRNPINRQIRMIMANEIAFAQHLMLNMVYQVMCGAPSGCPITTILNNGVNMFYLRTAFVILARENNAEMYVSDYTKYISTFFYGDDLIMTVKDEIITWFNATTLSEFFARYDIKFTDALKTGDMSLYTTVFAPETSFLKRNIKRHDIRPVFTAAMDKRAIEETCNWTFVSNDLVLASIISCESMLLNAHGHGEEYYEFLRNKVFSWWRQFGECPNIPCWRDVDWRIYEGIKPINVIDEDE